MTNESFKKLLIDNSLVVLNRFILLDPLMLFFISATVFSMAHFNKQKRYHIYLWFIITFRSFLLSFKHRLSAWRIITQHLCFFSTDLLASVGGSGYHQRAYLWLDLSASNLLDCSSFSWLEFEPFTTCGLFLVICRGQW